MAPTDVLSPIALASASVLVTPASDTTATTATPITPAPAAVSPLAVLSADLTVATPPAGSVVTASPSPLASTPAAAAAAAAVATTPTAADVVAAAVTVNVDALSPARVQSTVSVHSVTRTPVTEAGSGKRSADTVALLQCIEHPSVYVSISVVLSVSFFCCCAVVV